MHAYPCRLFGTVSAIGSSRPEAAFTSTGFKDWKHASGKKEFLFAILTVKAKRINGCMGTV